MIDKIVAKRYADAFLGFAKAGCGMERALLDLRNLKNTVISDNPEFLEVLESPEIGLTEKNDFIDRVLNDEFCEETKDFLKLLVEKVRIDKLIDIIEFIRVVYSHGGEEEALLKTSFPLDLKLIKQIEEKLEKKFNKKLKFYIDLDGSLLGGVQVIIGNTVIDGTIRRRLDDLREKLKGAIV